MGDTASMSARGALIERIYAAQSSGDSAPLRDALAPDAVWVGIEGNGANGETGLCENRKMVVDRLRQLARRGRSFALVEYLEHGGDVAACFEVSDPNWPVQVTLWKLFRFDPTSERIVRIEDCVGREQALAALGTTSA